MKIIRFKEAIKQDRPDGRKVAKLVFQELNQEVSSMQMLYVTHPSNFSEEQHIHNKSYEIFLFMDNAKYRINGKDYEIEAKDIAIFEPGDIHGAIPTSNEVRLWIFQNPAIIDDKTVIE